MKRLLALASVTGAALSFLPTCRSTEHTVARIVTRTPGPVEVFVPPPTPLPATPAPAAVPTGTPVPATPTPTPTPTVVGMPVQMAPPPSSERSPGVLYEELVPTAAAITPQPTRTPTAGPTRRPGVYYEDPEGRPMPTATPSD